MVSFLKKQIAKLLRSIADKIDSDTCELNEQQAIDILSSIGTKVFSKDEACNYLNISRSKFDKLVSDGFIPRGKKRRGFKELYWYEKDLILFKNKYKE